MSGCDFPTGRPGGWPDAETAAAASRLGQLLRCRTSRPHDAARSAPPTLARVPRRR